MYNSRVYSVFSLIFRGGIANYTFLEALIFTEFKIQCFHFFLKVYGGYHGGNA